MLTFVGLGLFDNRDITVKGLDVIRSADHVFLEGYTSRLMGTSVQNLGQMYGKEIRVLGREEIEIHPDAVLDAATGGNVAFLVAGDPMVSTTHIDLRIRAAERGIRTTIIHGPSIASAVCGLTGLQNYRFGKSCSLPFPQKNWFPETPMEVIAKNRDLNLHTLVYLDIQKDRFMTVHDAVDLLELLRKKLHVRIPLYIGVARAGSDEPVVFAGTAKSVSSAEFGPPLHTLVIPGDLHDMERRYLQLFAGL